MHNSFAKSFDKFYLNEKYYFSYVPWAQKYKIKLFFIYFQKRKI